MVIPFDDTNAPEAIRTITDGAKHCNAVAIGPGLALTEAVGTIVRDIVTHLRLRTVADASAFAPPRRPLAERAERTPDSNAARG